MALANRAAFYVTAYFKVEAPSLVPIPKYKANVEVTEHNKHLSLAWDGVEENQP
jgi:hypothetical protein